MTPSRIFVATAMALALASCATVPLQADRTGVESGVRTATGAARVPAPGDGYPDPAWLASPLSAESAVQAALLNHPRVRAELSRLDTAQAERVQAGLLTNPMASLMALRPSGGGRLELTYSLMQSLSDLFTRSGRVAVATASQQRTEAEVLLALLTLAQDTEAAHLQAVFAQQRLAVLKLGLAVEVKTLDLWRRQAESGARPSADVLAQQARLLAQAGQVRVAESELVRARTVLAELLGLSSATSLRLPEGLAKLDAPGQDPSIMQERARRRPEATIAAASVAQARAEQALETGALRTLEPRIGPAGMRDVEGMSLAGLEVQVAVPLFDVGHARRWRASANVEQAEHGQEAVRRQVDIEVERALEQVWAFDAAAQEAERLAQIAKATHALAGRVYAQGGSDWEKVRDAAAARVAADLGNLDAQYEQHQARLRLARATGSLALKPVP